MRSDIWRHFDFWLLGAMSVLVIFGIAMINSAIAGNIELIEADAVNRQILFALVGLVVVFLAAAIDYHLWVTISRILYIVVAAILIFVLIRGETAFGAARQIIIGPVSVQPSELAKITIIIILSDFFSRNHHRMHRLSWIIRSVILTMGLVGLVIIQPDLSTSIVLLVIWFSLLWVSGLSRKYLIAFAALGIIIPLVSFPLLADYQQNRIINFIFPDEEARFGDIYNVNQALISIGSGGIQGEGYGQSTQVQLRFLKVRHSDFIFSTISAELGFFGSLFVILLLLFILWRCIRAARIAKDMLGSLIAFGVAAWIGFQAFVNIGMNLNLLPVTGLPLPFVSHGGSSLVSLMLGIGLVESVVAHHKDLDF